MAAIGSEDPVDMVYAGGAEIAVKRWGSGSPVLCLHATGHGSGDFAPFAACVGDRFEIVAIDWPGQGRSPPDGTLPRASRYADILIAICDALALDQPILIGNSIGGAAAIIAAHKCPRRFSGLVLCNPGGLAPLDATARFAIGRIVAFFNAGERGAAWFDGAFSAYYRHFVLPGAGARAQRDRIIAAGRQLAPLLAEAWRGFAHEDADLRDMTSDIRLPVWLAWARSDRLVAWGRSKHAAMRFPNRTMTLFRGGHAPFLEDTDRFAAKFISLTESRMWRAAE